MVDGKTGRRTRVLITGPLSNRLGGVAAYCAELHCAAPESVALVTVGSREAGERLLSSAARTIADATLIGRELLIRRPETVHLNPSLDLRSAVRDGLSMAIARALGHRPIVFLHGWSASNSRWVSKHRGRPVRALLNRAAAVVVLASSYRDSLREWGVTVPIYVESTCVPAATLAALDVTGERWTERVDSGMTLLVLGRVTTRKGVWTAVEAARLARATGADVRLVFAGDGPDLPRLSSFAEGADADWLTFLGEVRGEAKFEVLRRVDALLMPSFTEGMPLSLLEGMAAGLPIVTTRVGGVADFFVDGEMGYSCPPDDAPALAEAVLKLASREDSWPMIGVANRSFALRHFTPEQVWRRLELIYSAPRPARGVESGQNTWYESAEGGIRAAPHQSSAPIAWKGGQQWCADVAADLLTRLLASEFRGYDPYDGMNARWLPSWTRRSLLSRRLLTQAVKRSPVLLQPLLGAPKSVSATTVGYSLLASARLQRAGAAARQATSVPRMAEFVRRLAVVDLPDELAWGSHVDVATRFGFTPASLPNVVVTACAAHGLCAVTSSGLSDERPAVRRVARFITDRLARRTPEGESWIAYTPGEPTMVHNGSMLGAATLIRCGDVLDDPDLVERGIAVARTVCAYQRPDGSWPYAEHSAGGWDDSFHTGFILEALLVATRHEQSDRLDQALTIGGRHYVEAFFGPHGEPWYWGARHYPLDAMSAAQGLEVLPGLEGLVPESSKAYERLLDWCRVHLLLPRGRVAYQVHRRWTDARQFPRWSVAPMAAALAGLAGLPEAANGGGPVDRSS